MHLDIATLSRHSLCQLGHFIDRHESKVLRATEAFNITEASLGVEGIDSASGQQAQHVLPTGSLLRRGNRSLNDGSRNSGRDSSHDTCRIRIQMWTK
jgi:hypothetical protein